MAPLHFAFDAGDPREFFATRGAGESVAADGVIASARPRGLVLKRFTLNRGYDGVLKNLFHAYDQIFFVITSLDLSGKPPFTFPTDSASAESAFIELKPKRTFEFSLGEGLPVFPPRTIAGGLVVTILVAESDSGLRHTGEVVSEISKAVQSDVSITKFLATLANPAMLTVDIVAAGAAKIAAVAGGVMERNGNDHVGLFRGYFHPTRSWEGKLVQDQRGARVELAEI